MPVWIYTQGISVLVSSWIRRRILWKGYESKSTLEMNVYEIFFWFSVLVWEVFFSCWKWREFLSLYKVLTIFHWACVMYSSFARLYIFLLFCFGLSACLLFFCFYVFFLYLISFFCFICFICFIFLFTVNVRRLSIAK